MKIPEPAPAASPPRNNARPLRVDHGPDLAALVSEGLDESIPLAPTTPRIGAIPIRGRGRRERAWSWIDDLRALMLGRGDHHDRCSHTTCPTSDGGKTHFPRSHCPPSVDAASE